MMKKLLMSTFFLWCMLAVTAYSQVNSNWKWVHPSPQGNRLSWVKAWNATNWYAVGFAGTMMKTSNGGTSWTVMHNAGRLVGTSLQRSALYDAHFFDANTGFVVGGNGTVSRTVDAGATWTDVSPLALTSTVIFYQIYFRNATVGYLAGSGGNLYKTTDAGLTWTQVVTGVTTALYDVYTANDTLIMLATTSGNVRRSTDAGVTWNNVASGTTSSLYKIDFATPTWGIAVGASAACRITTDAGATWTASTVPTVQALWDIDFRPATSGFNIFLTGDPFYVLRSSNLGTSWDTLSILGAQPWTSTMYASDMTLTGDSILTVGAFGLFQGRAGTTGNAPFTQVLSVSTKNDIATTSNGNIVVVVGAPSSATYKDQIIRSTDGGVSWSIVPFSTTSTATLWSIDAVTDNVMYVSGTNGSVYKSTNAGATWDSLTTPILSTAVLRKIDFVDANTGWVFASSPNTLTNFIYKTTDGGTTWTPQTHGITGSEAQMYGSHMLSATHGYALTWKPIPLKTTDGGATWLQQATVDNWTGFLYDVKMVDTAVGYIVGSSGRFYKTTNGGTLWDTVSVPTRSYAFYSLEMPRPGLLMTVGATGVTLISTNGGASWTQENTNGATVTLNGSASYTTQNGNSVHFYAAGSSANLFKFSNFIVPVELVSFGASVNEGVVTLQWKTATELNNSGFEVERKVAEGQWTKIGFIQGAGTSTSSKEYSFVDRVNGNNKFSYRLRQVDFDGTSSYSSIVEVDLTSPFIYGLDQNYPNPFNPSTSISYRLAEKSPVTLKIYDMIGNEVRTIVNTVQEAGSYNISFNASGLASGVYVYKIQAGKYSQALKMMFVK